MTAPNEAFAVALLNIAAPPDLPLVKSGRPDFEAIDRFHSFCSRGETELVELAVSSWRGFGFCGAIGALDAGKRAEVIAALNAAYTSAPLAAVPSVMPSQQSWLDAVANECESIDQLCDMCDLDSFNCHCDDCNDCGMHISRCICEMAS